MKKSLLKLATVVVSVMMLFSVMAMNVLAEEKVINIEELLKDSAGWQKNQDTVEVSSSKLTVTGNGTVGAYVAQKFSDVTINAKLKAEFVPGDNWIKLILRASNPTVAAWSGDQQCYAALFGPNVVQIFKWVNATPQVFATVEYTGLADGTVHDVSFSAIDTADGVKLTFKVDGEVVAEAIDSADVLKEGYFSVMTYNDATAILTPVQAAATQQNPKTGDAGLIPYAVVAGVAAAAFFKMKKK